MPPQKRWEDHDVEQVMGNLLRAGVALSAVVVLIGGVLYLWHYGGTLPQHEIFKGEPSDLKGPAAVARFALSEHSRGLIQLGLLLLIATPIARVVFSVYAFARERDWLYTGITLLVLSILLGSLIWSRA